MNTPLYPLVFAPIYKDSIWGGDRIARRYGRTPAGFVAEAWELADRAEGMSVVSNGMLAGVTLHKLVCEYGEQLVGRDRHPDVFPLIVKIIDAQERLSVQVHPDEESAARLGGEPKTEMWYVLEADPGAMVYIGLKAGVTEAVFRNGLGTGQVAELLQAIPARPGDVFYVPGGRVHAIGAGCLLLEVQQNSNTTYRIHDWGRLDRFGRPRELHLEPALCAIRWDDRVPVEMTGLAAAAHAPVRERLVTKYFRCEQIESRNALECAMDGSTFHALFVESGSAQIETGQTAMELRAGTTVLVPASLERYALKGGASRPRLLRISLP